LGGSHSQSGRDGEENSPTSVPADMSSGRPSRSLVAVLTELFPHNNNL